MTGFIDLFSGIGGFALGAYWAGLRFDKHYFSEVNDYAIQVYKKHFPEAEPLGDIRNVDYAKFPKGEYLVTGGFPCQPHSLAGKRQGNSDERDLWPECARMLRELRPKITVFENVPGLFVSNRGRFFNRILSDISESGYDTEWQIVSAKDVGAPHLRKRVWIVAYSRGWKPRLQTKQKGRDGFTNSDNVFSDSYNTATSRLGKYGGKIYAGAKAEEFRERCCIEWWTVEPDVGRVADGVSARVDRLKGLGNAIVPQCIANIFYYPVFDYWRLNVDNNK
jgi:DNA (cytosine-5)-methyltransferase 1